MQTCLHVVLKVLGTTQCWHQTLRIRLDGEGGPARLAMTGSKGTRETAGSSDETAYSSSAVISARSLVGNRKVFETPPTSLWI